MTRLILVLYFAVLVTGCSPAKWKSGDEVCFKLNGGRAMVKWASGPASPPYYVVLAVDSLNRVYEVNVYEDDIQECSR